MAKLLKGAEAAAAIVDKLRAEVEILKAEGIKPKLAVVRVGEREDDVAYERGAAKRCAAVGIGVESIVLKADAAQEELIGTIEEMNRDEKIHGVLLLRPLPKQMDDNLVRNTLSPEKDVDGITDGSLAGVFASTDTGYPPCTARACIELLDHYGIEVAGKKAVVIGRSLVVGKPVAMMLLKKNATVTVCHTKTKDMASVCREADVLVAAAGRANVVDASYVRPGQTVIDVGINMDENGKLCGDVKFEEAEAVAGAITPVPGGVGAVTTAVLCKHVVEAARKARKEAAV